MSSPDTVAANSSGGAGPIDHSQVDTSRVDLRWLNAWNSASSQAVSDVVSSEPPPAVLRDPHKTVGTFLLTALRWSFFAVVLFFTWECVTTRLKWPEQVVIGVLMVAVAGCMDHLFRSPSATLALMLLSCIATARYGYWRISKIVEAFHAHDPSTEWKNVGFLLILLLAEIYAFLTLYLGYFQTIWPLHRPPARLPDDEETWPAVDVFVPTYNEDLSVVRATVFAALHLAYPRDRFKVYVLDDGNREEFRTFCAEVGSGYIVRTEHSHAKAGNLNHALAQTSAPLVAIFDADHIPTESFLQATVGWFLRDPMLGVLQTPHYFYTPDPFDHNLEQFLVVPSEANLFYGCVQDGNDLWNASFFCGSCAVLRRTAIAEAGGFATDTVTEDAHTSLRIQTLGWSSAYINIPQAAGLATETLARHIGQRVRWARGMAQIARRDNPLKAAGLDWPQRICYFNAVLHFFFGLPRLIFATAPLVYLLLGRINIPGDWVAIMAYALPHLYLVKVANNRSHGPYRHPGWNSVYEMVLAPYIILPTLLALISPKAGAFNVTAKGGRTEHAYFDRHMAWPYTFLLFLNLAALAMAPVRFFLLNSEHRGAVVMNTLWVLVELGFLGVALRVAHERRQVRATARIKLSVPVQVRLPSGEILSARTEDVSIGGAKLRLILPLGATPQEAVHITYPWKDAALTVRAQIVDSRRNVFRIRHEDLLPEEEELLTRIFFTAPERWVEQESHFRSAGPVRGALRIARNSMLGIGYALANLWPRKSSALGKAAVGIILLAGAVAMRGEHAGPVLPPAPPSPQLHSTFLLHDLGVPEAIVFRGVEASRDVPFSLPQTEVPQSGSLDLRYAFSPSLIAQLSHLNVLLNHVLVASLKMPPATSTEIDAPHVVINLPAELLVRNNVLTFEFVGHYTMQCEDPSNSALWARIESSSKIDVVAGAISLANDLGALPLPFYDGAVSSVPTFAPVVFRSDPSYRALEAAGVLVSRLGMLAQSRPLNFPVTIGRELPKGNALLIVERWSDLPSGLNLPPGGPTVALRTNPQDPYGKLLIVAGANGDEVLMAARALSLVSKLGQGSTLTVTDFQLPGPRDADDAPYWLPAGRITPIINNVSETVLKTDGSGPIAVYLHFPPDLYYGGRESLPLHLDYRYNALSLSERSTMRFTSNDMMVGEIGLPHESAPASPSHNFDLPLSTLRPFSNTLLFNFYFQLPRMGGCRDLPPIDLQGAILRSSSLDLRGLYHWAALPDLELFANAGFPFTRFADLSQTRIILPPKPSAAEVSVFLALMAYFGEQTGYPALRVEVGGASLLGEDKDYIILGNAGDQPAFEQIAQHLPVVVRPNGFTLQETTGLFAAIERRWWHVSEVRPDWWWRLEKYRDRSGVVASLSEPPDALLQGLKSPWGSGRSIVAIAIRDDEAATPFVNALWKVKYSAEISQSVSVLHGEDFSSYRLGESHYYVGHLPFSVLVHFWLRQYPWLIVVISLAIALMVMPVLRAALERRARRRLGVN